MAAATNNLNNIIENSVKQMNVLTDTIRTVIQNCSQVSTKSIKHANSVIKSFKSTIEAIGKLISLNVIANINGAKLFLFNTFAKKIDDVLNNIVSITSKMGQIARNISINPLHILKFNLFELVFKHLVKSIISITSISKPLLDKNVSKIFQSIATLINSIHTIKINLGIWMKMFFIKKSLKSIVFTLWDILGFLLRPDALAKLKMMNFIHIQIGFYINLMQNIIKLIELVTKDAFISVIQPLISFKMFLFRRIFRSIIFAIWGILDMVSSPISLLYMVKAKYVQIQLDLYSKVIEAITGFLGKVFDMVSLKFMIKILFGNAIVKRVRKMLHFMRRIIFLIVTTPIMPISTIAIYVVQFKLLSSLIGILMDTYKTMSKLMIGFFFKRNAKMLIRVMKLMRKLIRQITKIKIKNIIKANIKLRLLVGLLFELSAVIVVMIILTPIIAVGALATIALILGMFVLIKTLNLIIYIMSTLKVVNPSIFIKITLVMVLIFMLVAMGVVIMVFGLMVPVILKGILWFGLFLLGLIALMALVVGFCLLISLITPIIPLVVIGMLFTFTLIGMLAIMVGMLKLIEVLDLNVDKVLENVHCVLNVAKDIISSVFDNSVEAREDDRGKPWYKSIISWLGNGVGTILEALLSVTFLALTFASIAFILLIATQLRLLQELNLNPTQIENNVHVVLDVAQTVIDSIFRKGDNKEDTTTKKGFFAQILDYFCVGAMRNIITAILSVAYLALIVVSVMLILFIATELRILQTLDLNPDLIKQNVGIVISTAQEVINSIFDKEEQDNKPSDKNFFMTLVEWVAKPMVKIFQAMMSIGYLALTFISIHLIKTIAENLKYLQDLDLDPDKVKAGVNSVINTAQTVIDTIFQNDNTQLHEKRGPLEKLLRWVMGDNMVDMIQAIMAVGYLAIVEVAVGALGKIAENLAHISNLPSMVGVDKKVVEINKASKEVINAVLNGNTDVVEIVSMTKKIEEAEEYFKVVSKLPDYLVKMSGGLLKLAEIEPKKLSNATQNVKGIMSSINEVFESPDFNENKSKSVITIIEKMNKMLAFDDKQFKNAHTILTDYNAFVKKIEDIDLNKLETTVKLFEEMNKFSQSINGNFEKLAEVINEKIAPILEELKESVGSVETTVTKPTGVEAEKQGIRNNLVQTGQTNNLSNSEIDAKVDDRYKDNVQQRYGIDEILSKLSSIVDLFQNGDARVRTT